MHSRYERCLVDAAIGGRQVEIRLGVRRLFCRNKLCPAGTFAEQVDGLTTRYARRSPVLRQMLESIGLALGWAGWSSPSDQDRGFRPLAPACYGLFVPLPEPAVGGVRVLGVDDFAVKRGHVYGTVQGPAVHEN